MSLFVMPSLGSDMERAVLIEWLVAPGTEVSRGDVIAVVETDKGAIEIEVFETGRLTRYLVELDSEVEVGAPLAEIAVPGEAPSPAPSSPPPPQPAAVPAAPSPKRVPAVSATPAPPGGARVSPAARRLAMELNVDLDGIQGSGPEGAVVFEDVRKFAAEGASRQLRQGPDLTSMRRAIAGAMARSKREIPHYYLATTVDIEDTLRWLADLNAAKPPADRILAFAVFLKATALALRKHREFNGVFENDEYQASDRINPGVAIAIRGGGLVAPAIHSADEMPLDDLMAHLKDLTGRVRQGRFRMSELRDPTVTVTSLGDRGVELVTGVIYPPQVACIGFGKVVDRPWSMPDRSVVSRQTVSISLAADHRVSDGRQGGLLLNTIADYLRDPEKLATV
jgi:pyruvate dehydrogenase E2 component (dihydrolipoamide acetyltransferase)